jgi:RNA polymerase sigma-70 factor (family 1)
MPEPTTDNVCDEQIFRQLFNQLSDQLFRFLYFKSGNAALAEDFTQEAFLRLWKACQQVSSSKAKAFLFRVGANLFLDEVKHQQVKQRFQLKSSSSHHPETPEEALQKEEFRKRLEQAIAALPEKQRTVFLLHRYEQMTYKQIADLLEISVKAVEKRMHKALIELRKLSQNI